MKGIRIRVAGPSDVPALFDIRLSVVENAMTLAELRYEKSAPKEGGRMR